jgi:hypothetical protein
LAVVTGAGDAGCETEGERTASLAASPRAPERESEKRQRE